MKKKVRICQCSGKMCYSETCYYCGYSDLGNENWCYCNYRHESVRNNDSCSQWTRHYGRGD